MNPSAVADLFGTLFVHTQIIILSRSSLASAIECVCKTVITDHDDAVLFAITSVAENYFSRNGA
jgi:hypothetical protein